MDNVTGTAFLLTGGAFLEVDAKTSHGLIRGSSRFTITAVIDPIHHGQDAGKLLAGKNRNIPIFESIDAAIRRIGTPDYCIIGIATVGGVLPVFLEDPIKKALTNGISIVNGLHDFLQNRSDYVQLASENHARLIDIRKPRKFGELRFWTSEIYSVACPVIALLGTDCAVGKRTTGQLLLEYCQNHGMKAEMVYTGQTGWMQGYKYGFIFDATINDFVSGELAHAIIQAYNSEKPDLIFIEGQSSLRNPSGPCGSEILVSGNAKYTVLVHELCRKHFDENPEWGIIPSIESEVNLIESYGSRVIALILNTRHCNPEEVKSKKENYSKQLDIPVLDPFEEGMDALAPVLRELLTHED